MVGQYMVWRSWLPGVGSGPFFENRRPNQIWIFSVCARRIHRDSHQQRLRDSWKTDKMSSSWKIRKWAKVSILRATTICWLCYVTFLRYCITLEHCWEALSLLSFTALGISVPLLPLIAVALSLYVGHRCCIYSISLSPYYLSPFQLLQFLK
jgi:hypothetical protein